MTNDSSISKFFEKTRKERLDIVKNFANLSEEELEILQSNEGGISFEKADKMIENAIGTFSLPLGIATNFKINGKDHIIPMVIEEPSTNEAIDRNHHRYKDQPTEMVLVFQAPRTSPT